LVVGDWSTCVVGQFLLFIFHGLSPFWLWFGSANGEPPSESVRLMPDSEAGESVESRQFYIGFIYSFFIFIHT
jgi:hypothetical protein